MLNNKGEAEDTMTKEHKRSFIKTTKQEVRKWATMQPLETSQAFSLMLLWERMLINLATK